MKNLLIPCFLAFSLMASAQFTSVNEHPISKDLLREINLAIMIQDLPDSYAGVEEEIELDFDINQYLPETFDVYAGFIIDESSLLIEEEIPFDFDINAYLPSRFDPYKGMFLEEVIEEDEIPFDFCIQEYLPAGFNPKKISGTSQY